MRTVFLESKVKIELAYGNSLSKSFAEYFCKGLFLSNEYVVEHASIVLVIPLL